MYFEKIDSLNDLKKLSIEQLKILADEMREVLLLKLSSHGGHIGPNLGTVELIIAMHYVFNSPIDQFVFDVSHQSYVHKMLTGRKQSFLEARHYDDVSGFTNPDESEHDLFCIGHTSTSISLACGLMKARDLRQEKNNIVAVIGDGSLSGGEAYEGMNNVVEVGTNMIVIVNDNEMSIAENHGGLYQNLKLLRDSKGKAECNFFEALGFEYFYIENGHDMNELVTTLKKVKDVEHPVVVHVHTIKGKGFKFAEENKEMYHAGPPFDRKSGKYIYPLDNPESYPAVTAAFLIEQIKKNPKVAVLNSGTPGGFGMNAEWRKEAGSQYIDVGIAEEHAVAMASGMAKNGVVPVLNVYSTFLQRAYDQLSQDLCINENPAVILVYLASVYGMNDKTHVGIFDIVMLGNMPNIVYLAPTCVEEHFAMLKWAMTQREHPVAIRVPAKEFISSGKEDTTDYNKLNKFAVTRHGRDAAIIALGDFYTIGRDVADKLKADCNMDVTLINPKFISGLDTALLDSLKKDHKLVVTLEDGVLEGGFGQKIASYYGTSDMKVKNYGIKNSFPDRYNVEELLIENGITVEKIAEDMEKIIG
ncbi:MAG: 1-deoxy-D-xylulose-5-phosphate synthase [Inconstantimicrobium porci]|uniref:1-deoxy-D-xylulose-5-phosphate synthase n=1 Tax=Inconstantimicrobium porci TaxID=2652291 RepID=UPI002A918D7C|nr:1-deoxy-D-xylulose-5-phosphate synthase [Inconstantimicrobium porci]MDY5911928.1 1-deoxy-D-xylulose-5-phosphate synthase [Inconstantimicrobium porci]